MKSVITISREAGSPGDAIGYELARRLGYTCVNRSFVDLIARKARVAPWQVTRAERLMPGESAPRPARGEEAYDERQGRSLDALIRRLGYGEPLGGDEYIEVLRSVMRDLAAIGHVVIIGRGGQVLLKEHVDAFHIRVLAPRAERIEAVGRDEHVCPQYAAQAVDLIDGLRLDLLKRMGCEDINDPSLYDMVIQTEGVTVAEAVDGIVARLQGSSTEQLFEPMMGQLNE